MALSNNSFPQRPNSTSAHRQAPSAKPSGLQAHMGKRLQEVHESINSTKLRSIEEELIKPSSVEAQAVVFNDLLKQKEEICAAPISEQKKLCYKHLSSHRFRLSAENANNIYTLFSHVTAGRRDKAIEIAEKIFGAISKKEIGLAAVTLANNKHTLVSTNSTYNLLIDAFVHNYEKFIVDHSSTMPLETAKHILLLALTYTKNKTIGATIRDEQGNHLRTEAIPFNEKTIQAYINATSLDDTAISKLVIKVKGMWIGNRSSKIAETFIKKEDKHREELILEGQILQQSSSIDINQINSTAKITQNDKEHISTQIEQQQKYNTNILNGNNDPAVKQAIERFLRTPSTTVEILNAFKSGTLSDVRSILITYFKSQRLTLAKAEEIAARMTENEEWKKLKAMLEADYASRKRWGDLYVKMRDGRGSGKKARTDHSGPSKESIQKSYIDDKLRQNDIMMDKSKGQKALDAFFSELQKQYEAMELSQEAQTQREWERWVLSEFGEKNVLSTLIKDVLPLESIALLKKDEDFKKAFIRAYKENPQEKSFMLIKDVLVKTTSTYETFSDQEINEMKKLIVSFEWALNKIIDYMRTSNNGIENYTDAKNAMIAAYYSANKSQIQDADAIGKQALQLQQQAERAKHSNATVYAQHQQRNIDENGFYTGIGYSRK